MNNATTILVATLTLTQAKKMTPAQLAAHDRAWLESRLVYAQKIGDAEMEKMVRGWMG